MGELEKRKNPRYQLRSAAGLYWILDMEQEGVPYRKPLPINEIGAGIWKMMEQGMEQTEIADAMCREYKVERETVLQDIVQFRKSLREYGICCIDER